MIRPFELQDAEALYRLHGDPEVTRYAGGTKTRDESRSALLRIIDRVSSSGFGALALQQNVSGDVIGWCGIQRMRDFDEYEVLYALATPNWGQGLAYEAAAALMAVAFETDSPRLERICGLVFPQNIRSIRVLEKLGMHFVRDHLDQGSGKHTYLYSISRVRFIERHSSSSK
ncbi:MAG: GNAT family N-acetyltransferase [Gammaproteobacteria bacterium]|nr:GNAT family N-acetyltransferase [Gammaproteobacteria bacterium]